MQLAYTETPAVAIEGMLADTHDYDSVTGIVAAASVAIIPGRFLVRSANVNEQIVKLPASASEVLNRGVGIALFQDLHINPNVLTGVERSRYQPEEPLPIIKRGVMWVRMEDAFDPDDRVFVRFTVGTTADLSVGRFRTDADPTAAPADRAVEVPFFKLLNSGIANGLAKIRFDFARLPT